MKKLKKLSQSNDSAKVYKEKIAELEKSLEEARSSSSYYKGRYEQAVEDRSDDNKKFQRHIGLQEERLHTNLEEVFYLRNLVMQLTVPAEKLAGLRDEQVGTISNPSGNIRF